jgi:hypothetical protein
VEVNCGTYATFATTADGHVYAFGLNNYGQLALPGALPHTPSQPGAKHPALRATSRASAAPALMPVPACLPGTGGCCRRGTPGCS